MPRRQVSGFDSRPGLCLLLTYHFTMQSAPPASPPHAPRLLECRPHLNRGSSRFFFAQMSRPLTQFRRSCTRVSAPCLRLLIVPEEFSVIFSFPLTEGDFASPLSLLPLPVIGPAPSAALPLPSSRSLACLSFSRPPFGRELARALALDSWFRGSGTTEALGSLFVGPSLRFLNCHLTIRVCINRAVLLLLAPPHS